MKRTLKLIAASLFVGAVLLMPSKALAQKIGYINSSEIVALMPERDKAIEELQKFGKELSETQNSMRADLQTKISEYQEKSATWSDAIKKTKEEELTNLNQRIEQFNHTAEQDFASRQEALLGPVMKKAQEAINKVAKAEGFSYIIDTSSGALVYIDEATTTNILPLVKKELGIPASKTQPTQFNNN